MTSNHLAMPIYARKSMYIKNGGDFGYIDRIQQISHNRRKRVKTQVLPVCTKMAYIAQQKTVHAPL